MKAARATRYGPADVIRIEEGPTPVPSAGEVLIRVDAAAVTTADWRLRAAAFPAFSAIPGRLIASLNRHGCDQDPVAGDHGRTQPNS